MAKKSKAKAKKGGKKSGRKPFKAPINTKTGAHDPNPGKAPRVETISVTPGTTLKSLLSTCRGYKANVDSIVSKLREEIGYAVEKKHLHKSAFAKLRQYDKMEAEKAAEEWHTLVRYMELSGVMTKIEAAGRLPLGDNGEDGEAEPTAAELAAAAKAQAKADKAAAKEKPNGAGNGSVLANGHAEAGNQASADEAAAAANSDALRNGIKPAAEKSEVSKPHFGQNVSVGQAPGGSVHMLPDRQKAH